MRKFMIGVFLSALAGLAGCAANSRWSNPDSERDFIYRNWDVHIRDQRTVIMMCLNVSPVGCVYPAFGIAWVVNNSSAMSHECGHIDAFTEKIAQVLASGGDLKSVANEESMKDLILKYSMINNLRIAATYFSSASDCGSDVGKTGYFTREQVIGQREKFYEYIRNPEKFIENEKERLRQQRTGAE